MGTETQCRPEMHSSGCLQYAPARLVVAYRPHASTGIPGNSSLLTYMQKNLSDATGKGLVGLAAVASLLAAPVVAPDQVSSKSGFEIDLHAATASTW
jgi:hypothetical protein